MYVQQLQLSNYDKYYIHFSYLVWWNFLVKYARHVKTFLIILPEQISYFSFWQISQF